MKVCVFFSGGSDPYVGIPAGWIYANGCSLYIYMEEGKFYTKNKKNFNITVKSTSWISE